MGEMVDLPSDHRSSDTAEECYSAHNHGDTWGYMNIVQVTTTFLDILYNAK